MRLLEEVPKVSLQIVRSSKRWHKLKHGQVDFRHNLFLVCFLVLAGYTQETRSPVTTLNKYKMPRMVGSMERPPLAQLLHNEHQALQMRQLKNQIQLKSQKCWPQFSSPTFLSQPFLHQTQVRSFQGQSPWLLRSLEIFGHPTTWRFWPTRVFFTGKSGPIWITLPKTNSSHLKIGHPKRKFGFQPSMFRCELFHFREGKIGILFKSQTGSKNEIFRKMTITQIPTDKSVLLVAPVISGCNKGAPPSPKKQKRLRWFFVMLSWAISNTRYRFILHFVTCLAVEIHQKKWQSWGKKTRFEKNLKGLFSHLHLLMGERKSKYNSQLK